MVVALLISLVCALGWGFVDIGFKVGSKYNVGSWMFAFTAEIVAVVIWTLFFIFSKNGFPVINMDMIPFLIVIAIFETLGIVFLANGLKYEVSSAAPIGGAFSVISPIFAFFLFKEFLSSFHIIAIFCVLIAIYLLSNIRLKRNSGLFWGILAMIFWGLSSTLMAIPAREYGEYNTIFWVKSFSLIVILFVLFVSKKKRKQVVKRNFSVWRFAIIVGILETIATSAWVIGITHYPFINIAIIASLYPVIPVLAVWMFSRLDKKDRPTLRNVTGLLFSIFAVLIIIFA